MTIYMRKTDSGRWAIQVCRDGCWTTLAARYTKHAIARRWLAASKEVWQADKVRIVFVSEPKTGSRTAKRGGEVLTASRDGMVPEWALRLLETGNR